MLSLKKLDQLLKEYNCGIKTIYTYKGYCMFIEVVSFNTANIFILYIPSKYDIDAKNYSNTYEIKEFNKEEEEDIERIKNSYSEIELDIDINENVDIKDKLEDKYKKKINLSSINEDIVVINNTKEQLKRLIYCIENTDYKLGVKYKDYLTCVRRNDDIETYKIKEYEEGDSSYYFYIVIDLELLYSKKNNSVQDINKIYNGICKIMHKNHNSHKDVFEKLIESERDIHSNLEKISVKISLFDGMLKRSYALLDNINSIQKNMNKEKEEFLKKNQTQENTLDNDIYNSHQLHKFNTEYAKVENIKKEIVTNIAAINHAKENIFLNIDKILFDNNVMLNNVINNVKKISTFSL